MQSNTFGIDFHRLCAQRMPLRIVIRGPEMSICIGYMVKWIPSKNVIYLFEMNFANNFILLFLRWILAKQSHACIYCLIVVWHRCKCFTAFSKNTNLSFLLRFFCFFLIYFSIHILWERKGIGLKKKWKSWTQKILRIWKSTGNVYCANFFPNRYVDG